MGYWKNVKIKKDFSNLGASSVPACCWSPVGDREEEEIRRRREADGGS